MKILHSIGSFLNGGIETLLVNVVNRFIANGHSVAIMIVTDKWNQDMVDALDSRVQIFYINKPVGSKNPWYLLKMLYYYKTFNADVLHLHSPGSERFFFPKNRNERRVVTIHNETIEMPYSDSVDQYVAISQCVLNAFKEKTGHSNCLVNYNGVEVEQFRCKKGYAPKPYKIAVIGRILFSVKAQDLIVQAVANLPIEIRNEISVDIVGTGDELNELQTLVNKLKVNQCITLMGDVPNSYVAENLCNYDLLLCASHHEGLGITAIEGMVVGVPVLLSDALGYLEVSDNGKHAITFEHSNLLSLTHRLIFAYENYSLLCKLAIKSRDYAVNKFAMGRHVERLLGLYNRKNY